MMSLKYAVVGAGALGGYYGGKLAKSGHKVDFLVKNDYDFIKEHGLKVDSVSGDFHLKNVSVFCDSKDMSPSDVVLVCLKTTHNHLLKDLLAPLLHKDSLVILIQNGLGVESDLAKDFPSLNIGGALAQVCAIKVGPGHIRHLDLGKLFIGIHQGNCKPVMLEVLDNFTDAGVVVELIPLALARWHKLIWNIPFNGLSVVLNTTVDKLISNEDTKVLCWELMYDVIEAANYCGSIVKKDFAKGVMSMTEKMTSYSPSMKVDYDNKRDLEIEYIYSRPIAEALAAGYKMKNVSFLEKQLRFLSETH